MSTHSYTRLWTHMIWETLSREPMLDSKANNAEEFEMFVKRYGLEWRDESNR